MGMEPDALEPNSALSREEIRRHRERIEGMGREEMARLRRFAPIGHPYFDRRLPLNEAFEARFAKLGGFSPGISKKIGWEP